MKTLAAWCSLHVQDDLFACAPDKDEAELVEALREELYIVAEHFFRQHIVALWRCKKKWRMCRRNL